MADRANVDEAVLPDPDYAGLINALIAAANAANNRNPQAPPPAIVPFALVPGQSNNQTLDFNKPADIKLFNRATKPLDPKFDLKEGNLYVFLSKVREQARIYN
jgi:hypothetical protein